MELFPSFTSHSHVWFGSLAFPCLASHPRIDRYIGTCHLSAILLLLLLQQEVLIKGLANSKTFQRFALRTDHHVQQYKQKGQQHVNEALDDLHKTATETMYKAQAEAKASGYAGGAGGSAGGGARGPPTPPLRGFGGFISAVGKEIKKDLGLGR